MTRYLLNSAVITAPGTYTYHLTTPEEARAWLAAGPYHSTIGYPETARALELLLGLPGQTIRVSREVITMAPGDEALVFRLHLPGGTRPGDLQKGQLGVPFVRRHSELGLLRRLE